jgi:isoleucyl-tRNA synthetase
MLIKAPFDLSEFYKKIIEEELNVKQVVFTDDVRDFTTYTFKPQLKTVGPKYGKQLGGIKAKLSEIDGNNAMDELKANGFIAFDIDGVEVKLAEEDLLIDISQKEGYVTEADNTVTVVLDTNLTEDLIEEGFVYEIISKIQTMRKDSGFEVMDHIAVYVSGNDKIAEIVKKNATAIGDKVLANSFAYEQGGIAKEWNINGETVTIGVEKI